MEKRRPAIVDAFMEMPRQQQALMAIILLFWLAASVAHLRAWITHNPPLKIELVIFTNAAILALAVWHSVMVKGRNATIAFFSTAVLVSWFCEFIGHNYGWFFGKYNYTDTLWLRVGGVPVIIIITWSGIIYSAFMLIDWLVGLNGETRARTWWGKTLWSGLLAAATATLVCAWDLMIDPFATSGVWAEAVGKQPWWFWMYGGPYLRDLKVPAELNPAGGVPIGNFVGWWLAPFFIVFIFCLFFQRPNRIKGSLINFYPVLSYAFIYFSVAILILEMQWYPEYGKDMVSVAMIGFFTMMPVILTSLVKLVRDYSRPLEEMVAAEEAPAEEAPTEEGT
jgi:uncharacterized membrane protein